LPDSSRRLEQAHLKTFFNFAIKRDWCATNPVVKLDSIEPKNGEVEIFSVTETEALLNYALDFDLRLLPYFIFTFLEGIRPDGEILKLEWKHVHQAGKHPEIVVEPSVAKTGRRRFVPIPKNARAWLEAYRQHGGVMEGLIVTYGREALREHRRKAQGAANIKTWIQSGARHSFCSYWLAEHKGDVNKLVLISGHDDPDTMWRHYHRGTTEAEAHKFWSILPPVELPNVIAMKKVRKTA